MIAPAELAQRKAVIAEARSWIGTAYHHRAAVKATWDADGNRLTPGGVDCATLLAQVYEAAGIITPVPIPSYPPDWHMHRKTERYADTVTERAREITEAAALPGDVVMYRFGHSFSHAAIVMPPGWPSIVHAFFASRLVQLDRGDGGVLADDHGQPRPRRFFTVW